MEIFSWLPDQGYDTETDTHIREVKFGEGVVQLQRTLLGAPKRQFSLKFTRSPTEVDAIEQFLSARHGGRFWWRRDGQPDVMVRCAKWRRTTTGFVDELSCTLTEERV